MKKRVAGGVVLVAIAVGIWLSNLFKGLGPGGAGTDVGTNPDTVVSLQTDGSADSHPTSETAVEADATAGSVGRPVVVIDGYEYFLEQRDGELVSYLPATLERIVELAGSAEPDADGVRVQIKRRGSSRPSAETALDTALRDAGLTDKQILRHDGFVE